ncbi:hypothetical protein JOD44_002836 [Salimicrobium jeotgali]|nr:hypothetical protein [Salimicrobium jeotgali]
MKVDLKNVFSNEHIAKMKEPIMGYSQHFNENIR